MESNHRLFPIPNLKDLRMLWIFDVFTSCYPISVYAWVHDIKIQNNDNDSILKNIAAFLLSYLWYCFPS